MYVWSTYTWNFRGVGRTRRIVVLEREVTDTPINGYSGWRSSRLVDGWMDGERRAISCVSRGSADHDMRLKVETWSDKSDSGGGGGHFTVQRDYKLRIIL